MAGVLTWLSCVRKNAGPRNPIDCIICQKRKFLKGEIILKVKKGK